MTSQQKISELKNRANEQKNPYKYITTGKKSLKNYITLVIEALVIEVKEKGVWIGQR